MAQYQKKESSKHKGLAIHESGLIIDPQHPYLAATPDRIRNCDCCGKILLEVKSLFSKRNLVSHIAAQDYLQKKGKVYFLREESNWNYQIQGQLGLARMEQCDLIIYTQKGIMVVSVAFNQSLWEQMLLKLKIISYFIRGPRIVW